MLASYAKSLAATFILALCLGLSLSTYAQSGGSSTSVNGTVVDPTGVSRRKVQMESPVDRH